MHERLIVREDEGSVGVDVGDDLAVCGIPDIVPAPDVRAELLKQLPSSLSCKLMGMSPDVKEHRAVMPGVGSLLALKEGLRDIKQARGGMMAARVPAQKVGGDLKALGRGGRARIRHAAGGKDLEDPIVYRAVRIRHTAHDAPELILKHLAVLDDVIGGNAVLDRGKRKMPMPMRRDLKKGGRRKRLDLVPAELSRVKADLPRLNIEGCLDLVSREGLGKALIVNRAVVVAHGVGLSPAPRESH